VDVSLQLADKASLVMSTRPIKKTPRYSSECKPKLRGNESRSEAVCFVSDQQRRENWQNNLVKIGRAVTPTKKSKALTIGEHFLPLAMYSYCQQNIEWSSTGLRIQVCCDIRLRMAAHLLQKMNRLSKR
jgi:hypothetical protein